MAASPEELDPCSFGSVQVRAHSSHGHSVSREKLIDSFQGASNPDPSIHCSLNREMLLTNPRRCCTSQATTLREPAEEARQGLRHCSLQAATEGSFQQGFWLDGPDSFPRCASSQAKDYANTGSSSVEHGVSASSRRTFRQS